MPTDKASYKKVDHGDTIEFRDSPPKVWPDGSAKDAGYASIAPKQMNIASGSDTYQGIPGDGIVGGKPGSDHSTPATWGFTSSTYAEGDGSVAAVPGGGGGAD